jgi:hypothetical protein
VEQKAPPEIQALWWLLTALLGIITTVIGWAAKHMVSYVSSTLKKAKRDALNEAKREQMIRESHVALYGTGEHQGLIDQFAQVTDAQHTTRQLVEEVIRASPELSLRIAQRRVEADAGSGPHRALQHMPTGRVPTLRNLVVKQEPDSEPPGA